MTNFYEIHKTNISEPVIQVPKFTIDNTFSVALTGKIKREYGNEVDESLLNLLENFSCPSSTNDIDNATPDMSQVTGNKLSNPVKGQFWYNSTLGRIYFWDGIKWKPTTKRGDYAANWGMISHGEQLPKPVSTVSGKVFEYDECIWTVSPATFLGKPGYMACSTDMSANVTMLYRYAGTSNMMEGQANYLIIGINGNVEHGDRPTPALPSVTPTPTPSKTPPVTPTNTPTMTVTRTVTPTPTLSLSPSRTPQPSVSATPQPTPTRTPSPSVSATPQPTPTRTPSPSVSATPLSPTGFSGAYGGSCYSRSGNGQVQFFINFDAAGPVTEGSSFEIAPIGNAGNWLGGAPNTGDYEIMFQGTLPDSLSSNVWYNLSGGANFIWSVYSSGNSVRKQISGTFSMRRASTGVVFSTAQVLTTELGLNFECL